MQMLEDSLYLENIQEYVHDEDKIVSYKWLSRKLEVPVNVAKQMLYAYVSHCRSSEERAGPPVTVTYIVSGVVERNGNKDHQVCLVDEDSLEATREQFHCVLGVHIFSVQKAMPKDSGVLYAADYEFNRTHLETYSRWSTIECPTVPLPESSKPPSKPAESSSEKTVSSQFPRLSHMKEDIKPVKEESTPQVVPVAEVNVKTEKKPTQQKKGISKPKVQAKGSVASFFAKQGDKMGEVKPAPEPPPSGEKQPRAKQLIIISPKKSPVKSPVKSPRKRGRPPKKSKSPKKTMTDMFQGLHDSDIEDDSDSNQPAEEPAAESRKEKPSRKTPKAETLKGPRNGGTHRKHKRVQDLSSDEEMSADGIGKAEMHAEDTTVHVKRRKKLVTKMYVNDEGAMVTEKVWESASEDEPMPTATSPTTDSSRETELPQTLKPEKLSPVRSSRGAKQASLMSFFKK